MGSPYVQLEGVVKMLGAILAPFMVAGVLGALVATAGAVLVVDIFRLVEGTFARLMLFTLAAGILPSKVLSG